MTENEACGKTGNIMEYNLSVCFICNVLFAFISVFFIFLSVISVLKKVIQLLHVTRKVLENPVNPLVRVQET